MKERNARVGGGGMRRTSAFGISLLLVLAIAVTSTEPGTATASSRKRVRRVPYVVRDRQAGVHELEVTGEQQADTATEPSLAVNPEDPMNAVIGYQAGRVDGGCAQTLGYGTTFDGGKTWRWGALPKLTTATGGDYPLASDPVIAFGPGDTVYFNELLCGEDGNDLATSVSKDGGRTWSDPILVPPERTFPDDDKNWIVVDNSDEPGHHLGRVYLVWDNVAPVVAMYSDDEAQTWQGPFVIYEGQGIGTLPLVMPNGDLGVVFGTIADAVPPVTEPEQEDLLTPDKFVISIAPGAGQVPTGGPLAFTAPVTIAAYRGTDVRQQRAAEDLSTAAVDHDSGTIYVAWSDNRFREDDVNDVVIVRSEDGGATWTPPTKVTRDVPDNWEEHFTPALDVAANGSVHIAYRVQRQAPAVGDFSPFVDTYYRESRDGGEHWTKALRLNRRVRTDVRFAAYSRESAFLGDYSQVAVAKSWTYVVRCEAFRLSKGEPAAFPPKVHHQRAWVAVVDSDRKSGP